MRTARRFLLSIVLATEMLSIPSKAGAASHGRHEDGKRELAFRLLRNNLIVVEGRIGSLHGANILLDTGTNHTMIDEAVESEIEPRGNEDSLYSIAGSQSVRTGTVTEIEIGAIYGKNLTVVVARLKPLQEELGMPIAAVAGLDLLRTRNFMVDYAKKRITFDPLIKARHEVRFEKQEPALLIRAKIEGRDFVLLLDSGAARIMLFAGKVPASLVEKMARCEGPRASGLEQQSTSGAKWYRANRLSVGELPIPPQEIAVIDSDEAAKAVEGVDGLFSVAMLGARRVWFDFQGGRFLWE